MQKTINGTIYKTDLSTDDCYKCVALHDDDLCGNLCHDNKNCVNNIWRKVKVSKKKLKLELKNANDKHNELYLSHIALIKVHDLNETSLNTCERELHYRDRFDLDVADFVARIIEKVARNNQ